MTLRLTILLLCLGLTGLSQTPRQLDNPVSVPMSQPVLTPTFHLKWTVNNGYVLPTFVYHASSISGPWYPFAVVYKTNTLQITLTNQQEYFMVE